MRAPHWSIFRKTVRPDVVESGFPSENATMQNVLARMLLYYVRHGLTGSNIAGRLQGHRDTPLNQTGRAQAVHCGEILRRSVGARGTLGRALRLVSSPLSRARDSMEIMRATLGIAPTGYGIEPRLTEINPSANGRV